MEKKKIHLAEILPAMEASLAAGGTVKLPITGTSMLPLLVQGRDTVILKKPEGRLSKYDIPFYRRIDGTFVLHRILEVGETEYTLCGDNQWVLEHGITDAQIIGVVTTIHRKGKAIPVTNKAYRLYVHVWRALLPIRKYIVKLRGIFRK